MNRILSLTLNTILAATILSISALALEADLSILERAVAVVESTEAASDTTAPVLYSDDTVIADGTCGNNLKWTLTEDGLLVISGEGDMPKFWKLADTPWYPYMDKINSVVIKDGVTSIGRYAFEECTNLKTAKISDSVTDIGICAFRRCTSLENIEIGIGVTDINAGSFSGCINLRDVYYCGTEEQWNKIIIADSANTSLSYFADIHLASQDVIPGISIMKSGNLLTDEPSKQEITAMCAAITDATSIYKDIPSTTSPYSIGKLSDSFLENGITFLNYVRFVAHLPSVQLSEELIENAQYGAVVLAANDVLSHYPSKPEDMGDSFFEQGYTATRTSNLGAGYVSFPYAILDMMADSGSNSDTLGHRRWFLNPTLLNVGFGMAGTESGYPYCCIKVFDRSGPDVNYDFIAWPSSGYFPSNLFGEYPWSVTLNPGKYDTERLDEVEIEVTRQTDGKTWRFDHSTTDLGSTAGYMHINTSGYGVSNCISFNFPIEDRNILDTYTIEITGIYDTFGGETFIRYEVDLFKYVQPGDINNDSKINTLDLVELMKHIVGTKNAANTEALDMNGDGNVDILDILRLMRYLAA